MIIRCVVCHKLNDVDFNHEKNDYYTCKSCKSKYVIGKNYLKYDFDKLLYKKFKKNYLKNKVLNNNAYISYQLQTEASCGLAYREDIKSFKDYIESKINNGKIIDIGCGILEAPGYLNFDKFEIFGLDPIDSKQFKGFKVIGCSEFMPFEDSFFDAAIFCTSLDHVCSIEQTLKETYRILKPNGKVIIFMGYKDNSLRQAILEKLEKLWKSFLFGYDLNRYMIYPEDNIVYYIPPGAKDPFHSMNESPEIFKKYFKKAGFKFENMKYNCKSEIFMSFEKQ